MVVYKYVSMPIDIGIVYQYTLCTKCVSQVPCTVSYKSFIFMFIWLLRCMVNLIWKSVVFRGVELVCNFVAVVTHGNISKRSRLILNLKFNDLHVEHLHDAIGHDNPDFSIGKDISIFKFICSPARIPSTYCIYRNHLFCYVACLFLQ